MFDVDLFRKPAFSGAVGATMIAVFAMTGLVFFLSQYFQNMLGYSPLEAGLRELTLIGITAVYGVIAVALVVIGGGVGLALTLTTDAVVSAVPADKAGAASAVSETAYELGAALGIAVLGTVLSAWGGLRHVHRGGAGHGVPRGGAGRGRGVGRLPAHPFREDSRAASANRSCRRSLTSSGV